MATFNLTFTFRNATKGTFRMEEDEREGEPIVVGGLYLRKDALKGVQPAKVAITLQTVQ